MSLESNPRADAVCEGGDLDCGSGLLLIIREAFEPLAPGGVLEIRSSEISVKEDLPAWCRMVGHALLAAVPSQGRSISYFVRKSAEDTSLAADLEEARNFRWQVRAATGEGSTTRVFARNHHIDIGQPASFDTADAAPSAVEVLLAALAGDLVAGLRWRASRAKVELQQMELSLSTRASDPGVFLGLTKQGPGGLAEIEGRLYVQSPASSEELEALWSDTLARSLLAQTLLAGTEVKLELKSIP
ncbi:MAG TPA: OsmC family protein [Planctomycetota bacterium]|nr:OsmC family protein [Planctomycetota bacterium]